MSELSKVAKLLAFEGCHGWSLERKVKELLKDNDSLNEIVRERDEKIERLEKTISEIKEFVSDKADL